MFSGGYGKKPVAWNGLKELQRELHCVNLIFVSFERYCDIKESLSLKKYEAHDFW